MAERVTYCRICEPLCGLVATVEGGRLVKLRPDRDHPLSRGFACPKGIAMTDVQNDPDRVLHPLRRGPGGRFERVSWEEALDDIGERLRRILDESGGNSTGWYMGNPAAFSYSHPLWVAGFMAGIGSRHLYGAGSQDVNNRFAASALLYGSPFILPIPDLARTELLLIVGANPLVSHGSVMSAPRVKEQLHAITGRGGRVVVVDPRRSETARAFEHLSIEPDGDAWLLLSLLQVIFEEGLEDAEAIEERSRGAETLKALASDHPPEATAAVTGVPPERVRDLARSLATAPSAAIYGRTGSCLGRQGTLVSFLLDALAVVTGNLDREGGSMFGASPVPFEDLADRLGVGTYGRTRSRVGGFPDVLRNLPATLIAKEITTPGDGRIRALFVSAGNPVISVPNGDELEAALDELDLLVSIDLYVNDTNRRADYVLPATTFLEREDFPLPFLGLFTTPFIQMTEAVVEPYGEARQEWEVIEEISRRIGVVPSASRLARLAGSLPGPLARRVSPRRLFEVLLRLGPRGDRFGLRRGGLNPARLRESPHGIVLGDGLLPGALGGKIRHRDGRVRLDPPEIVEEEALLERRGNDDGAAFPLRMIGLRELRSHNSWMHNSELLMRGGRSHAARIHPDDAAEAGVEDEGRCRIASPHGAIEVRAALTDEVRRGTIAVPHGWGHRGGGWRRARDAGGANVNLLSSSEPEDLERLAGMAHLNGVPVRLDAVAAERD